MNVRTVKILKNKASEVALTSLSSNLLPLMYIEAAGNLTVLSLVKKMTGIIAW